MTPFVLLRSRRSLPPAWRWVQRLNPGIAWSTVAPFGLPFLLYLLTMAPTIYNLDSAELTTAVASDGLIRATGYPLYLLLGKVWTWLPVGDMGYRLNLFSAVCGAGTIWLADRILRRLDVSGWARLGALGLLATAPYFWAMSLIAEVYTLHTILMTAILLLIIRWRERPTPWRLALPIGLMALSLGNHAATVLLVPGCVLFVLVTHPRELRRPFVWLASLGALMLGLMVFLVLPLRYSQLPPFNYAGSFNATGVFVPVNLQTWDGFWWLVSGQSFSGQMFGYAWLQVWSQVTHFGGQLWQAFLGVGIGPGLYGMVLIWRRDKRVTLLLFFVFVTNAIFYVNYRVVDKDTMFLPAYLIWALWAGIGFQGLLDWLRAELGNRRLRWAARSVLLGSVLLALVWNWSLVDRSHDWSTREQSELIMSKLHADAIVFGWWDTVPGLQYLQLVEGRRQDVLAINRFLISGEDMNNLIFQELGHRPIYINNPSITLLRQAKVTPVGPLYLLEPRE